MRIKAAEILAGALEQAAEEQEQGDLPDLDARRLVTDRQVAPINDIPRPIFKLAQRFWKDWAYAARHEWRTHGELIAADWPEMARTIATHVRLGTMPSDQRILGNFVRRRVIRWRDLKTLLRDSE